MGVEECAMRARTAYEKSQRDGELCASHPAQTGHAATPQAKQLAMDGLAWWLKP